MPHYIIQDCKEQNDHLDTNHYFIQVMEDNVGNFLSTFDLRCYLNAIHILELSFRCISISKSNMVI